MMISSYLHIFIFCNHLAGLTSFMIVAFDSFLYVQVNFCYSESLQSVQPHNVFVWIRDSLVDIHGYHVRSMVLASDPWLSRQIRGCHDRSMALTSDPWLTRQIHGCHFRSMVVTSNLCNMHGCHVRFLAVTSGPWLSRQGARDCYVNTLLLVLNYDFPSNP